MKRPIRLPAPLVAAGSASALVEHGRHECRGLDDPSVLAHLERQRVGSKGRR